MLTPATAFSSAHRLYVKSLYRRYLKNALDWTIRRDVWRGQAMQIRAEFEANRYDFGFVIGLNRLNGTRHVTNPRALAEILQKAEEDLAEKRHPDPYICMVSLE